MLLNSGIRIKVDSMKIQKISQLIKTRAHFNRHKVQLLEILKITLKIFQLQN